MANELVFALPDGPSAGTAAGASPDEVLRGLKQLEGVKGVEMMEVTARAKR